MTALLVLALFGFVGVLGFSSSDDDPVSDEPLERVGTEGQEDLLIGSEGDDTLIGNFGEPDVMDGRGGDDLLFVQDGNVATGGTGSDVFDVTDGAKAVITDFDPEEDVLQVLFPSSEQGSDGSEGLNWQVTENGVELHALRPTEVEASGETLIVTLLGLNAPLEDGALFVVDNDSFKRLG